MPKTGKRIARTKISQNQTTTVPKPIREDAGVGEGDEVDWYTDGDNWIAEPSPSGENGRTDDEHTQHDN